MSKKKDSKKKKDQKMWLLLISLTTLIVLLAGLMVFLMKDKEKEAEKTLAYTDLIKELSYGNIEKVEMTVGSTTVKVKQKNAEEEKTSIVPNTESFIGLVQEKVAEGNEIELVQKPRSVLAQLPAFVVSFLPTLIMLALDRKSVV